MKKAKAAAAVAAYRKDLESLENSKVQTEKVSQESVDSTRRMLQLVQECDDAGINTLRMLEEQGETLNRADNVMDDIDEDLTEAEKTLKRIEYLEKLPMICLPCYLCCCQKKNDSGPKNRNDDLNDNKKTKKKESEFSSLKKPDKWDNYGFEESTGKKGKPGEKFVHRITGGQDEDELDDNLSQVSMYVQGLKSQAIQMGTTVEIQNDQLDKMNLKSTKQADKVTDMSARSAKIVNSDSTQKVSLPMCPFCVIS